MTWHDITWYDMIWHDMTWHDMTWHDTKRHNMTWHDMTLHYITWHDMTWHDMPSRDITWHDMTSYHGMIWYDVTLYYILGTCITWYGTIWHDTTWHDITLQYMLWHDMTSYRMTWQCHDTTWHDMTWYDLIWYDMLSYDMTWHGMPWHEMVWCAVVRHNMKCTPKRRPSSTWDQERNPDSPTNMMADLMHAAEAVPEESLEAVSFNKVRRRASGNEIATSLRKAVRTTLNGSYKHYWRKLKQATSSVEAQVWDSDGSTRKQTNRAPAEQVLEPTDT